MENFKDEDLRWCGKSASSPLWDRREKSNDNDKCVRFYEYDSYETERLDNNRFSDNIGASTSCSSGYSRRVSFNSDHTRHDNDNDLRIKFNPKSVTELLNVRSERRETNLNVRSKRRETNLNVRSERRETDLNEGKSNEKEEPAKKVWITALPAGMERNISVNPGPMTGKKYRKRLKKALIDHLDDAECMLNCKILRTNESLCSANTKETGNARISDSEIEIVSSNSILSRSNLPGLENSNDVQANDPSVEKCSLTNAACPISEESRLLNIKNQAKMKLNKLNYQLNYLEEQFNILSCQGAAELNDERLSQVYKTKQLQRKIKEQISSLEKALKCIGDLHQAEAAINFGSKSAKDNSLSFSDSNSTPRYIFYDGGDHLCKLCSELFTEVESLIKHVYDTHVHFFSSLPPENRPWAEPQKQVGELRNCQRRPFRGCEFLLPCQGFFCDLCKINISDEATAKNHLESELHNISYASYCELNPNYEKEMEAELKRSKIMKAEIEKLQTLSAENVCSTRFQVFDASSRSPIAAESSKDDFDLIWISDSEEAAVEDRFDEDEFAYIPEQDESSTFQALEDQCLKSATF